MLRIEKTEKNAKTSNEISGRTYGLKRAKTG